MECVNKAGHLMSLAALQQYDPYIVKLLDVAGQVALYTFNSKANEWVRSQMYCHISSHISVSLQLLIATPPVYYLLYGVRCVFMFITHYINSPGTCRELYQPAGLLKYQ